MSVIEKLKIPSPPPLPLYSNLTFNEKFKINQDKQNKEKGYGVSHEINLALERIINFGNKLNAIFYQSNVELMPLIQDGPKCGLVALSIASSYNRNHVNVDNIFHEALSLKYTKKGEIFKAEYLADLAKKCCGFTAEVLEGGLELHFPCIIQNLIHRNLLLVPYDADHNHSPCCKNGYKAHWAVISGFVVLYTDDKNDLDQPSDIVRIKSSFDSEPCNCLNASVTSQKPSGGINVFCHGRQIFISKNTAKYSRATENAKECEVFLIARQGKSKHVGVWSFNEMAKSNENLLYFSTERNCQDYILPEGGPAEGLRRKFIILNLAKNRIV